MMSNGNDNDDPSLGSKVIIYLFLGMQIENIWEWSSNIL